MHGPDDRSNSWMCSKRNDSNVETSSMVASSREQARFGPFLLPYQKHRHFRPQILEHGNAPVSRQTVAALHLEILPGRQRLKIVDTKHVDVGRVVPVVRE